MSAGDVDQNPNLTIVDAYQILLFYSGRKESL